MCVLFLHVQSLKTYQLYHGEWQQAEAKMRHAENQKMKLERQQSTGSGVIAAKSALSRRFRNVEKLSEKVCRLWELPECKQILLSATCPFSVAWWCCSLECRAVLLSCKDSWKVAYTYILLCRSV